ncbi:DNA helicase/exodeoxyribonuclease V alpha subunit [Halospina denitrificans]|uniref:RecBCD enzyme subunit RecD n=1 Tax=Halospina denitrificans TaxID=332522 RepID=A0A4R7JM51_9GAMM|nr:exodeoxyribonuclease V subunit alpha [Halospina denitrificans]TDT37769.1 DNA helicase/exodeoxyribonuclease V alpha subunit [Halospina denitrificans]
MTTAPDTAAIDRFLADHLCDWLDCRDDWLWYSILAVSEALREGHSCLNLACWASATAWATDEDPGYRFPELDDWLNKLDQLPIGPGDAAPLVLDQQRLYLRRYWRFETELADSIRSRLEPVPIEDADTAKNSLSRLFPSMQDGTETDWQAAAAANALFQKLSVIAGGPGTGKTFTVTRLLALLAETEATGNESPLRVRMAAPTGKAAQRLGESVREARQALANAVAPETLALIPDEATTLHRLLGVIPHQVHFRHNRDNPLALDVLLVDEVSMIDLPMMTRLFRALPDHARIILLGDPDQLPSVAAGSVLADLALRPHPGYSTQRQQQLAQLGLSVETGSTQSADYLSYLYRSRRFSDTGGIGKLARQVMDGDAEGSLETLKTEEDGLAWIEPEQVPAQIEHWVSQWYAPIAAADNRDAAFAALAEFRLLCPTRVGPLGSVALNERILKRLNPEGRPFYRGQPIMVTENHYGLGLFNGDIGLIWPDEDSDNQLLAWFPDADGYRPLAPGRLPPVETVYAMTIHKTQGSEFERVALILPEQSHNVVSRELLYTGLTRARSQAMICGRADVWKAGVRNPVERHSGLAERLFAARN